MKMKTYLISEELLNEVISTLVDYHDYTIFVIKENNISKIKFK